MVTLGHIFGIEQLDCSGLRMRHYVTGISSSKFALTRRNYPTETLSLLCFVFDDLLLMWAFQKLNASF